VDTDGTTSVVPHNSICGDVDFEPPPENNHYDFELIDVSDAFGLKVLIYDGVVIGPNGDPVDPAGMPSGNSYVLGVAEGDEVWIGMTWSMETDDSVSGEDITSVWIANGPSTPDDDGLTTYVTIGHIDADYSSGIGVAFPTNELCGDLFYWLPPDLGSDGTNDLALVVDKDTGNRVWKKVCAG
jgi:hypothetical protein